MPVQPGLRFARCMYCLQSSATEHALRRAVSSSSRGLRVVGPRDTSTPWVVKMERTAGFLGLGAAEGGRYCPGGILYGQVCR